MHDADAANVPQILRRALVIGGGGFMMEGKFAPIDRKILSLTGKSRPRVCILPTPAGDAEELLERFYSAFDPWCDAYQLTPFRKPTPRSVSLSGFADELLTFDALFVSGGSTKSALGVWREWGIDKALVRAYEAGVLLSGMSAGAICWFDFGFTDSFGDRFAPLPGLGLIPGGCNPHHNGDAARAFHLVSAIDCGEMPGTLAIDDFAAVLFQNDAPAIIYSWREGATARVFEKGDSDGGVVERLLLIPTTLLAEA